MSPPQRHIHRGCPESPAVPGTPTPASRTPPPRPPDPYQAAGQPNAGQAGTDAPPDADAALAQALSSRQLQEEQRDAQEEEEQQVEQEEGTWRGQEGEGVMGLPAPPPPPSNSQHPPALTAPILVAEVGEAPDVAQAHGEAQLGQYVLGFTGPGGAGGHLLLLEGPSILPQHRLSLLHGGGGGCSTRTRRSRAGARYTHTCDLRDLAHAWRSTPERSGGRAGTRPRVRERLAARVQPPGGEP